MCIRDRYFEFSLMRKTVFKYKVEDFIFMAFEPAASETEYCNFGNNITQIEKTGYAQSITGFSSVNQFSTAGQTVCGLEYSLAMQIPYELQEGVMTVSYTHLDVYKRQLHYRFKNWKPFEYMDLPEGQKRVARSYMRQELEDKDELNEQIRKALGGE